MVLTQKKIRKIIEDPEVAASVAHLEYVSDEQLDISRVGAGKGFYYKKLGSRITDKENLERIKALVIPPNWADVRIASNPDAHLQCVGYDEAGRKQYRYHNKWSQLRNQTKFFKMVAFGNQLPAIRQQVEKDLRRRKMNRNKCIALVIALMEDTHIRIGNESYAKRNKTYGLTTLRKRHLTDLDNELRFDFTGKRGVKHQVTIDDPRLVKLIHQSEEIRGWELFHYIDEEGKSQPVDSGMVNDYLHEVAGDLFTAKDFRTWAASKVFFQTLYDLGLAQDEKQVEKNLLTAYDATAAALGNTRAVCRQYYVHPMIADAYEDGSIVKYFDVLEQQDQDLLHMSETELALQEMLSSFELELADEPA